MHSGELHSQYCGSHVHVSKSERRNAAARQLGTREISRQFDSWHRQDLGSPVSTTFV